MVVLVWVILHSKSIILIGLCLVLKNFLFLLILTKWFKVNDPVKINNDVFVFLVLMYLCLNVKPLRINCIYFLY